MKSFSRKFRCQAFTLVEIMTVMAILAILSTMSFIGYGKYVDSARNSGRQADIASISKWLNALKGKDAILPTPDGPIVTLTAWAGNTIVTQWYAGDTVLARLKLSKKEFFDPKDQTRYTYAISADKHKYELLSFLETRNNAWFSFAPNTTYAEATDYLGHSFFSDGDKLGILLDTEKFLPLQQVSPGATIDVISSTGSYVAILGSGEGEHITGTGIILQRLNPYSSCKRLKEVKDISKDGVYPLNSGGVITNAYCDMTSQGGGWTLVGIYPRNGLAYGSGAVGGDPATGTGGKYADDFTNHLGAKQFYFRTDDGLNPLFCQAFEFDYSGAGKAADKSICSKTYSAEFSKYITNWGWGLGFAISHWNARDLWLISENSALPGTRIEVDNQEKWLADCARFSTPCSSGSHVTTWEPYIVAYHTYDISMFAR